MASTYVHCSVMNLIKRSSPDRERERERLHVPHIISLVNQRLRFIHALRNLDIPIFAKKLILLVLGIRRLPFMHVYSEMERIEVIFVVAYVYI